MTKTKSVLKEFLEQAFNIDNCIQSKNNQIQRLKDMQTNISGKLSLDKVQTSPDSDKLNKLSDDIMDLENECLAEIEKLVRIKRGIKKVIEGLSDINYRLVLEERYVSLKKWEDIAVDNNYSERHVYDLHGEALRELTNCILQQHFEAIR